MEGAGLWKGLAVAIHGGGIIGGAVVCESAPAVVPKNTAKLKRPLPAVARGAKRLKAIDPESLSAPELPRENVVHH